eukprot:11400069-Karenia_brevis.AAC.1
MGATQMHLMERGWEMQWYQGQVRFRDQAGDVGNLTPKYGMGLLRSMLEGAREKLLWEKAALHRHGQ